ncbi:unnamed protein product [Rhizoctonia solani]|uniref:Uncharacterized protein n=1 Tax=Rhizoctonia solani TaxID=456999 RepID=A0A8H3BTA2_9AGAM|nr:unnamed protein product [Rhizoctonia solani]
MRLNRSSLKPTPSRPKVLITLSGLPKLEYLCVVGLETDRAVYCDNLQTPIPTFPALKHLELNRLTWDTIFNLCNDKFLIGRLHSLIISYPHDSEIDYPNLNLAEDRTIGSSDIIPLLAANNSSITTLALRFPGDRQVPPEVLKSCERLPLVNFELGWSVGRSCGFNALGSTLSRLPLLEDLKLNMVQRPFDLKQLRTIVESLPRLRRIRIPVKWESITQLTTADFTPCRPQSHNTLYLKSDFYLPKSQQEGAEQLARYLSLLRPASAVVCESFQAYFYHRHANPPYIDEQPKDMINIELSRLRSSMEMNMEFRDPRWPR